METAQKAIRETNHVTYCCLLHSMDDEICFNLVDTAKTEHLPDGDTALAWKNLLARFELNQFRNLLSLKNEFFTKSFEECKQNPNILYLELKKLRKKISSLGDNNFTNEMYDINPANVGGDKKIFYARARSNMIAQRILGSLTKHALKQIWVKKKYFTWTPSR